MCNKYRNSLAKVRHAPGRRYWEIHHVLREEIDAIGILTESRKFLLFNEEPDTPYQVTCRQPTMESVSKVQAELHCWEDCIDESAKKKITETEKQAISDWKKLLRGASILKGGTRTNIRVSPNELKSAVQEFIELGLTLRVLDSGAPHIYTPK